MIRLASKTISFTHTTIKQDLGPIKYFLGSVVARKCYYCHHCFTHTLGNRQEAWFDFQSNSTPVDPNVQLLTKFVKLKFTYYKK